MRGIVRAITGARPDNIQEKNMSSLMRIPLALMAAVFIGSTPVIAADTATQTPAVTQQKPDLGGALKEKASKMVDQAKQKADSTADKLQEALGDKKDKAKEVIVDVKEETVTVETPNGVYQEKVTTITPEKAAGAAEKAATGSTAKPAGK